MIKKIFLLLRPHQWLKNIFIFLPLFFGKKVGSVENLLATIVAFFIYSIVASGIYCLNDIIDVESDKLHPKKCKRPIASGAVSISSASFLMVLCWIAALVLTFYYSKEVRCYITIIITIYILMNIAYCLKLKQKAIVDVFVIALGFVLRIFMGGYAAQVELSHWIVLMTFLLALFLAFAKRRDDVVLYEETGALPRKNVNRYNLSFMNQVMGIVASITMVCYILYTVSTDVMERMGSNHLYVTSIFVLAGIIRYLQLAIVDVKSGSPTTVLMKDRFIQFCIGGWIFAFLVIIYL